MTRTLHHTTRVVEGDYFAERTDVLLYDMGVFLCNVRERKQLMKNYVLRSYQANAANAVMQAIRKGHKRISMEMAPGTGKSFVLAALVEHLLSANIMKTSCPNTEPQSARDGAVSSWWTRD